MKRYLKLFLLFAKYSFIENIEFRTSFYLFVFAKILRIVLMIVFFEAVFLQVKTVGSWTKLEVLVLLATFFSLDFLISITWHRNFVHWLPRVLRTGEYDFYLTKPVNLIFYTALQRIDPFDIVSSLPMIILWIYLGQHLDFALSNILIFLVLCFFSLAFLFAFMLFLGATTFFTLTPSGTGRFSEQIMAVARLPLDVYPKELRFFLTYFFPIILVATYPTLGLLGKLNFGLVFIAIIVSLFFLFLAWHFWHFALRHYQSASS